MSIKNLVKKRPCLGTWSMLGSPMAVESIASSGLDFIVLDLEHGLFDFNETLHCIRAIQNQKSHAIIRVSENTQAHILRALESKPDGILIPNISSYKEAEKAVRSCYYAPQGIRGLSPYTRVHHFHHDDLSVSMQQTNEELLVGILVEGKQGIEDVETILTIPGLDVLYFGIYDFALALGYQGDINHPNVKNNLERIIQLCASKNVVSGTFIRTPEDLHFYKNMGLNFLAFGADCLMLKNAYLNLKKNFDQ